MQLKNLPSCSLKANCTASEKNSVAVLVFSNQEGPGVLVVVPPEEIVVFDNAFILQPGGVRHGRTRTRGSKGWCPCFLCVCKPKRAGT